MMYLKINTYIITLKLTLPSPREISNFREGATLEISSRRAREVTSKTQSTKMESTTVSTRADLPLLWFNMFPGDNATIDKKGIWAELHTPSRYNFMWTKFITFSVGGHLYSVYAKPGEYNREVNKKFIQFRVQKDKYETITDRWDTGVQIAQDKNPEFFEDSSESRDKLVDFLMAYTHESALALSRNPDKKECVDQQFESFVYGVLGPE